MLRTRSGQDSRRHADNLTRNTDNSSHNRPARTVKQSRETAKVEFHNLQVFQYLATIERRREPILSPWVVGMMMILVGLTGLTLAWIQHRQEMKALKAGNWSGRGGQPGLALGEHDEGVEEVPAVFGGGG